MGLRSRFSRDKPLFRRLRWWIAEPVAREHAEQGVKSALSALQPVLDALTQRLESLEAGVEAISQREAVVERQLESLHETQSILIREKEHIGDHLTALQKDFDVVAGADGVIAKLSSLITDLQHVQTEVAAVLAKQDGRRSLEEKKGR